MNKSANEQMKMDTGIYSQAGAWKREKETIENKVPNRFNTKKGVFRCNQYWETIQQV